MPLATTSRLTSSKTSAATSTIAAPLAEDCGASESLPRPVTSSAQDAARQDSAPHAVLATTRCAGRLRTRRQTRTHRWKYRATASTDTQPGESMTAPARYHTEVTL